MLLFQVTVFVQNVGFVNANYHYPPLMEICIQDDGTITPYNVPIRCVDNVYTFTDDISGCMITVQCDDIVINGKGHRLSKSGAMSIGTEGGVFISNRNNVTIRNLNVTSFNAGVFIRGSTNCCIIKNNFSNNAYGVVVCDNSTNNYVSGNQFISGGGISIRYAQNNTFKNNEIYGDGPFFSVECNNMGNVSDFVNDADSSNTIKGKQICYWVNQHNQTVPSESSYVALINCSEIAVESLSIAKNGEGVLLIGTTNSQITNNNIIGNNRGLVFYLSENNEVTENHIINSTYAIVCYSHNNGFKNNYLAHNVNDANFEDRFIDTFDYSNIVDGTPICYWTMEHDKVVPEYVGYVVLVGCSNITVQNLNITYRACGILLMEVTDSLITKNIEKHNTHTIIMKGSSRNVIAKNLMENNDSAMYCVASHSNTLSTNRVTNTTYAAIHFEDSSDNKISDNYLAHNGNGLILNRGSNNLVSGNSIIYCKGGAFHVGESTDNTVTGNNIAWGNNWALSISGSVGNNKIYHNNFINNVGVTFQVYPGSKTRNMWDNSTEGNFWSDYRKLYHGAHKVEDSNIMDTPVVINKINIDRYPLINPVDLTYQVVLLQPTNRSYESNNLDVVFFATATDLWMGYSLDNQKKVATQGNATLENLADGSHRLTVYAGETKDGECVYETVYFTVGDAGTTEPEPEQTEHGSTNNEQTEPNVTSSLLSSEHAIILVVAVACGICLVWFLARRK
jgi:parallel beta-helix repeat protein